MLKSIDIGGISHTLIIEACYVGFPITTPPYVRFHLKTDCH